MQTTYIFGHKIPDTDTVCATIALSYLKNKLGDKTEPRVLGSLNKETKYVLDRFNIEEPKFLNDVKQRIRNMNYVKKAQVEEHTSIYEAYNLMKELDVSGLAITNNQGKLTGYVNVKEISKYLIDGESTEINTKYQSLIKNLKGKQILKYDDIITGNVIIATYQSKSFIESIKLGNNDILIVKDRYKILERAIKSKIKLLILVDNNIVSEELLELAKTNKVNIISVPYDTYKTSNIVRLSNYVKIANIEDNTVSINILDYKKDYLDITSQYGHTNYPVVDKKNNCLGMARLVDINTFQKQKVILVDHNNHNQSVDGLEEAEILEIIDHHNISTLMTSTPITFRVAPLGCTCTLLYKMYKESNIDIPKNIAGIMLSSIISDTLLLKSPTTTKEDIDVAKKLAELANVDLYKYGREMFEASISLEGMSVEEIIHSDMKTFKFDKTNMVIAQTITTNFNTISKKENEFISSLNSICNIGNVDIALLFVTDVIKNGSYIYFNIDSKKIVSDAYGIEELEEGHYLDGVVSRKKQMLPPLIELIEKR